MSVNLQKLTEVFGAEWARTNILPHVIELLKNPHYLYRMTVLKAMSLLAVAMGQEVTPLSHPFDTPVTPLCHPFDTPLTPLCHPFSTPLAPLWHPFSTCLAPL